MSDASEWESMRAAAPFAPEAFRFVQEGLRYTVEHLDGSGSSGTTVATEPHDADDETPLEVMSSEMTSALIGSLFDAEALELPGADEAGVVGRHVSGQELCLGLRSLAVEKYGLLARTVLRGWGVRTTEDFGKIVYAMVEAGLLRTSENDSLEDFRGVYDFEEAFDGPTDRLADCGGAGLGGNGELG